MTMKLIVLLVAMAIAAPALAAPVSLKCKLEVPGAPETMHVLLNEEAGTTSFSNETTGSRATMGANFTPDEVTFLGYTIDRRSLALRRERVSGAIEKGVCAIDKTRAF